MTLSYERLAAALGARPLRYEDSVDSTNDLAMGWLRAGAAAGSVVIADEQRRGRGRMGRVWHTPPGVALAVSVILKPPPHYQHRIGMLGAVAVAELVEHLGIADVGIKWPNDVQIAGRKVCGILPEAVWEGQRLPGVVLGMGVNVRVEFDDELATKAASIEPELGRAVDRTALAAFLLGRVDYWAAHVHEDSLHNTWRGRLNMLGRQVQVTDGAGSVAQGLAQDVDEHGALLLRVADGSLQRVLAGDIMPLMDGT